MPLLPRWSGSTRRRIDAEGCRRQTPQERSIPDDSWPIGWLPAGTSTYQTGTSLAGELAPCSGLIAIEQLVVGATSLAKACVGEELTF
jgi:hypothetical protein